MEKDQIIHTFHTITSLIFLGIALSTHCSLPSEESGNKVLVLPKTDIRLEFRGVIQKNPNLVIKPPFKLQARAYSCPELVDTQFDRIAMKDYPECMKSYVEKIQEFNSFEYKLDLDVPENWTHTYIELLGLEESRGMYSPGHNPFWFGYTSGEIVTFRNDFNFKSQENPIPDKKQFELASRFSPILILKSEKKEIPTNLEKYRNHKTLAKTQASLTKSGLPLTKYESIEMPYYALEKPENLPNYLADKDPTHVYFHVRYANTILSGTQEEALPGFRDNSNYWYEASDGKYVISYWLWFDNNHGPSPMGNFHQGDLESYAVLCDAKGNPLRILTTGHDHITLDTEWKNINSINHHPLLYIASGNGSDGGNPISAYGGYEVLLEAGNALFNSLADPRDIFPEAGKESKIILPASLSKEDLKSVRIGSGLENTKTLDLSNSVFRSISKLVAWEEPGWVNKKSVEDPDNQHTVDNQIADFLVFNGRIGSHPRKELKYFQLKQFGESPRNAPFKINIEQHYTYERPRLDRAYSGREGNYGPKFLGTTNTAQFTSTVSAKTK